jgi:glycerate-2-kinase
MRIRNRDQLTGHGNKAGRLVALNILESGLDAMDPYRNTEMMIRLEGRHLTVGHPLFTPGDAPWPARQEYELGADIDRVFVFGAGKGIQRAAKALEDVFGDFLTGGHIIAKHGEDIILNKIDVTLGGHPVPDEHCIDGCEKILKKIEAAALCSRDLVFTIIGNGASSLLTLPPNGVSLDNVMTVTRTLQIELGLPTKTVNLVRNQVDRIKGGRLTRRLHPAKMIHIVAIDVDSSDGYGNVGYMNLLKNNFWLHSLPIESTPQEAMEVLKRFNAWEAIPVSVREYMLHMSSEEYALSVDSYLDMDCRLYGIMPRSMHCLPAAVKTAEELGYPAHVMTKRLWVEAAPAAQMACRIALNVQEEGSPFHAPCALIFAGELLVRVEKSDGIGGRNQEFALMTATLLDGNEHIVVAAADTDGTDGPGGRFHEDAWVSGCHTLAGALIDGYTMKEANEKGVDVLHTLKSHSTSNAVWRLDNGIWADPSVSLNDLIVFLIMN